MSESPPAAAEPEAAPTSAGSALTADRRRTDLRSVAGGLLSVVVAGARLWWGHWPLLLTIALLGGAGRMAALWAAAEMSEHSNTGGVALLVLAPLCSVAAIVWMLHVLRHAMPSLADAGTVHAPADVTTGRERRLVDVLASVLVPFLAVYASYGLLAEDTRRYLNTVSTDEFYDSLATLGGESSFDGDRMVFATGWVAVAVVLLAMVLRWGLARWDRRGVTRTGQRSRWLAFAGAYVEVFWMVTLAAHLVVYKDQLWSWVEGRRAVDIVIDRWLDLLDLLGPVARPVDAVVDWAFGVLSSLDGLVVVPVAWLTVGAVVYGHRLVPPPARAVRGPQAVGRVPVVVRRWGGELVGQVIGDVRSRFTGLVGGLRLLAVAGLGPMLVFGLAFLAAARLEDGLGLLARALLGPQDLATWLAFSPHVLTVTRAVGLTVTMSLLAAAVDRVLSVPQSTTRAA